MITHYFKTTEGKDLETIKELREGEWVHVVEPTTTEFTKLVELYTLDDAIIEDIKDVFEVPRFEQDGDVSYFFTRYPYDVDDIDINTAPILIILGRSFIITIAEYEVPFLNVFIKGKRDFSTAQPTKFFLELMSELMTKYERKLTSTRKVVYRDMGRVRSIGGREIQRLVFLEQDLNETLSALVPTNEWFRQLTKGNYIQMFAEDRELLEDLLIANSQLIDSAKSILKTIQNIRGASEAILTQNLNHTIRMLTAFTIILTIPTLIASLFGMNVPIPFHDNPLGFWFILGIAAVIVTVTVYLFSRNRWI